MLSGQERVSYFNRRTASVANALKRRFQQQVASTRGDIEDSLLIGVDDSKSAQPAILRANRNYVPLGYPGRVLLFRATHFPFGAQPDSSLGWNTVAIGKLEIVPLPGFHGASILEPLVRILGRSLSENIRKE
jgi:hypothetical protein